MDKILIQGSNYLRKKLRFLLTIGNICLLFDFTFEVGPKIIDPQTIWIRAEKFQPILIFCLKLVKWSPRVNSTSKTHRNTVLGVKTTQLLMPTLTQKFDKIQLTIMPKKLSIFCGYQLSFDEKKDAWKLLVKLTPSRVTKA